MTQTPSARPVASDSLAPEIEQVEHTFVSHGLECAATLYRPVGVVDPPVLVMGHGYGATRHMRLPAYGDRFARAGIAVLAFDYRYWGDSSGSPRQTLDPFKQVEDFLAAVSFARTLPNVDPSRVAVWGTAFSGGHALSAAAKDSGIAAVVAQGPFVSGLRTSMHLPIKHQALGTLHAVRDVLSALLLRRRHHVRLAGNYELDGLGFAFANSEDSIEGEARLLGDREAYDQMNFVPAAFAFKFLRYRPLGSVRRVTCPALIFGMENDEFFWPYGGRTAAARMSNARYEGRPIQHWDPYFGQHWDEFTAVTIEFLTVQLGIESDRT